MLPVHEKRLSPQRTGPLLLKETPPGYAKKHNRPFIRALAPPQWGTPWGHRPGTRSGTPGAKSLGTPPWNKGGARGGPRKKPPPYEGLFIFLVLPLSKIVSTPYSDDTEGGFRPAIV